MEFFSPSNFLGKLKLVSFFDKWNYIIVIAFFGSLFLLIVQYGSRRIKKRRDKEYSDYIIKQQNELLEDKYAMEILKYMYANHPNAVMLPYHNQKVRLLQQFGLIGLVDNQIFVKDINNPKLPYVLQPIAEKAMIALSKEKTRQ
ncbi:superinfection exclusion B family protein [Lactobacillus sp. B4012]|nr:superinfection exclusion B family protein [Lactobacillus sp. B4010]MCX8732936.1 superinfection exclusion B family protein [Lactobacillus sp. B4015]MCX8735589.1 superinfection exclusion B family protein [Lactobacillus sp. B4012]